MMMSGGWMIGPAFISAPESASPQSSITPGKALPINASAWSFWTSGKTPVGSRLARTVIADFEWPVLAGQPGQGAGLGKRDLGAVADIVRGLGEQDRAECARRQEHDLAVGEMGRQRLGDIGLRDRRGRAQDQLGATHRLGDIVGDRAQGAPRADRRNP